MNQPTRSIPLAERPQSDNRRPELMAALALAETLVAFGEPVPREVQLHTFSTGVLVSVFLPNSVASVESYKERFGGTIHRKLRIGSSWVRLHTELTGRVYDGEFRAYTQTSLSQQELAAWFVAEHGDPADWSAETGAAYRAAVVKCPAVAV